MMAFVPVTADAVARFRLDGKPISEYDKHSLKARADKRGLPKTVQDDDGRLRVLLAALLAAGGAEPEGGPRGAGEVVSSAILNWGDIRPDAQAYLLAAIKREGCVSAQAAQAATLLNKRPAVESYQELGNRWTVEADPADESKRRSRPEPAEQPLPRPTPPAVVAAPRPWYRSKFVLGVLSTAILFVLGHLVLLVRVMRRVYEADNTVLFLPFIGLSASALVALLAIGINNLTN